MRRDQDYLHSERDLAIYIIYSAVITVVDLPR